MRKVKIEERNAEEMHKRGAGIQDKVNKGRGSAAKK